MRSIFALSALAFARIVLAQGDASSSSLSSSDLPAETSSPVASVTDSVATSSTTATATDSASTSTSTSSKLRKVKSSSMTASAKQSAPTANNAPSYVIPSGVSDACSKFLKGLDSDPTFTGCMDPLLAATSAFMPSSDPSSHNTASVSAALNTLCATNGCSDTYIRNQLTNFYTACKAELTGPNPNENLIVTYDVLYIMAPFKKAACTKDTSSSPPTYCVLKAPSSAASPSNMNSNNTLGVANNAVVTDSSSDAALVNAAIDDVQQNGVITYSAPTRRRDQAVVQYGPNTQVYRENGVMYLFTLATMDKSNLCTTCTKLVLAAYAAWESTVPYALGLVNSPMLGGQGDLWKTTQQTCGQTFMNAVSTAGRASGNAISAGMPSASVGVGAGVLSVVAIAASLWVAL
ncbi:hypothetical protein FRB99_008220 [Tulasnella sp. 403]|nr:hypothetical protein FRB99_008220 [Tulasnella sp. 403]